MDLINTAAQLLRDRLGIDIDPATISSALSTLMGDGQGQLDLASLAREMAGNADLGALLGSWLGDGGNQPISPEAVQNLFGEGSLSRFASQLGVSPEQAAGGLSDVLPQLVDQASSGGSLLDEFTGGAAGSLLGAAKSFLK